MYIYIHFITQGEAYLQKNKKNKKYMLIWTVTWLIVANVRARFFLLLLFSKVTDS